jgi:hypothetical protein
LKAPRGRLGGLGRLGLLGSLCLLGGFRCLRSLGRFGKDLIRESNQKEYQEHDGHPNIFMKTNHHFPPLNLFRNYNKE